MTSQENVYNEHMPKLLHRPRMPRPDDPDIIERFSLATALGHPVSTAATLAGISERAAHEWLQLGREQLAVHDGFTVASVEELGSHALFALAVNMAEADFVDENLAHVRAARHGDKGWLPAMTLLERRRPEAFARRFEAKVETTIDQHITFSVEALPPERQRALAELALRRLTAPEDGDAGGSDDIQGVVVLPTDKDYLGMGDADHQASDSEA